MSIEAELRDIATRTRRALYAVDEAVAFISIEQAERAADTIDALRAEVARLEDQHEAAPPYSLADTFPADGGDAFDSRFES